MPVFPNKKGYLFLSAISIFIVYLINDVQKVKIFANPKSLITGLSKCNLLYPLLYGSKIPNAICCIPCSMVLKYQIFNKTTRCKSTDSKKARKI